MIVLMIFSLSEWSNEIFLRWTAIESKVDWFQSELHMEMQRTLALSIPFSNLSNKSMRILSFFFVFCWNEEMNRCFRLFPRWKIEIVDQRKVKSLFWSDWIVVLRCRWIIVFSMKFSDDCLCRCWKQFQVNEFPMKETLLKWTNYYNGKSIDQGQIFVEMNRFHLNKGWQPRHVVLNEKEILSY